MKQVTFTSLTCSTTEDTFGADECRLEIYADGELEHAFRAELNDGMQWPLGTTVLFDRQVDVRLFDEDGDVPGDDDDLLGVVQIAAWDAEDASGTFDQGAEYTLRYSVTDRGDLAGTDLLELELQAFEASPAPGVWAGIDKAGLIADLRATLADPITQVNQNQAQFCGPTAIVLELVERSPRRYVRLCRQLFETGSFTGRTKTVTASEGLRAATVGQGMSPVDWMLIATMRESENAIFPVDPDAGEVMGGAQGFTTPWEMDGWAGEILLCDTTAISTTFVWGEFDAIRYAEQVRAGGGVAFVLVHSELFNPDQSSSIPPWPDHWIVYRGGLWEADGRIDFDVYTWGSIRHVSVPADRFESCMFAVVTGF
jgi:hypothetical protein